MYCKVVNFHKQQRIYDPFPITKRRQLLHRRHLTTEAAPSWGRRFYRPTCAGGLLKGVIRSGSSPSRRRESSSPAELPLFCAVPTAPRLFPSPSFSASRCLCQGFAAGSVASAPSYPLASVLGSGAASLFLNVGLGAASEALNPASFPGLGSGLLGNSESVAG